MSDIRLIILGSVFILAGLLLGGILGPQYVQYGIQKVEFGDCFDYKDDGTGIKVNCDLKIQDEYMILAGIFSLIGSGIFILIKGIRGKWDQNVRDDEMVGPKHP
ncbi:MAG: hypothetical protein ACYC6W_09910 [Nitrosotalea sp.]